MSDPLAALDRLCPTCHGSGHTDAHVKSLMSDGSWFEEADDFAACEDPHHALVADLARKAAAWDALTADRAVLDDLLGSSKSLVAHHLVRFIAAALAAASPEEEK